MTVLETDAWLNFDKSQWYLDVGCWTELLAGASRHLGSRFRPGRRWPAILVSDGCAWWSWMYKILGRWGRWGRCSFHWISDSPDKASSKTQRHWTPLDIIRQFRLTSSPSLRISLPSWRGDFCGRAQCGAYLFGASFQLRHRHPTAALLAVEPGTPGVQWDDHGGTAATFWSRVTTDHSVHRRHTHGGTHHGTRMEIIMGYLIWIYMI